MTYNLAVGTFDKSLLYTLQFKLKQNTLSIISSFESPGPHSWLSLNKTHTRLYATNWTTPPGLAAYRIDYEDNEPKFTLLNCVETASRSGYCCNSEVAVYSAGGASGEVFSINAEGAFVEEIQKLEFVDKSLQVDNGSVLDFGGLRHGSHSSDLSADGKMLYVADLGRNCIFVFTVAEDGKLTLTDKNIATRPTDAPRHVQPHPNGRYVYSLQEHTSMVDVFELLEDKKLLFLDGVKIIPSELSPTAFWADEVRLSPSLKYLFASTRGLVHSTKGYVAAFELLPSGLFASTTPLAIYETFTSGGWANAIEPAPKTVEIDGVECDLIALTDEEQGFVFMLKWDGIDFSELSRTQLPEGKAATAVWL